MDFGVLPPEINSGRLYSGPGVGPMLAAAATWAALSTELCSARDSYSSVISAVTSEWEGNASASMESAAARNVAWMGDVAMEVERVANQARSAAAAYETAFAAMVPPPVIAANRAQLAVLVATNVLGINTPAIALTEMHYGEMWAQSAAAMFGYASASEASSRLTPFTPAPRTVNPGAAIEKMLVVIDQTDMLFDDALDAGGFLYATASFVKSFSGGASGSAAGAATGTAPAAAAAAGGLGTTLRPSAGGADVSAGMGRSSRIGSLSAPPTWGAQAPMLGRVPIAAPGLGGNAAAPVRAAAPELGMEGGLGSMVSPMPGTAEPARDIGGSTTRNWLPTTKMLPQLEYVG
jgi:PPE-repeat protein